MEHAKLYINGMTCINCQTRIQNALTKHPGITQAAVSYETETADILYDSSVISLEQIQGLIDELGYSASVQKTSRAKIVNQTLRELDIIVILYFLLRHFGILNYLAPASLADAQMGYGMLFVIGLITSVHCIAMCGGINLSQTLQKDSEPSANVSRAMFQNAAAYNAGRIISYTIIGGILGGIGAFTGMAGTLQTSSFFQGLLKLLAGALMVVMGINMLGLFPGLRRFHLRISMPLFQKGKQKDASKGISKRSNASHRRRTPFIIGLFNGLMPCGPLQIDADRCISLCQSIYRSAVDVFLCAWYHSADARIWLDCSRSWQTLYKSRAGKPRNFLQLSDNDVEFCRNVVQATARCVLVSLCVV